MVSFKKLYSLIFFLILFFISNGNTSNLKGMKSYTLDKKDTEINATLKKPFSVKIESNRTTGFMWFLNSSNENILKNLNLDKQNSSKDYIQSNPSCKDCPLMVGVPGYDVFKFLPIKTGKIQLEFFYKQPWMKDTPSSYNKTLIVNIHE